MVQPYFEQISIFLTTIIAAFISDIFPCYRFVIQFARKGKLGGKITVKHGRPNIIYIDIGKWQLHRELCVILCLQEMESSVEKAGYVMKDHEECSLVYSEPLQHNHRSAGTTSVSN